MTFNTTPKNITINNDVISECDDPVTHDPPPNTTQCDDYTWWDFSADTTLWEESLDMDIDTDITTGKILWEQCLDLDREYTDNIW